jgi:hypothetical protein
LRNIDLVYKALLVKPQNTQQIQKTLDGLLSANAINTALNNLKRRNLISVIGKDTENSQKSSSRRSIHVYKAMPMADVSDRAKQRRLKKIDLSKPQPKAILKQLIIETNPLFMLYGIKL